ncbi:acetolactate synthase 2 small subunit [Catenovulum sp. 2E275]|uniref:acetolactate synthase 2 small subunit n=1 Tax=Catenovulum sp. 2E275 TaxID=2980497 RepID=UPI0021CE61EC|nr:acetolactate synthase 2 small subunit [Catenovulum sp. 2E275]MCU4675044.1 acetolactate synthase 2 small subunit [Catenovulum sp. 2E275]
MTHTIKLKANSRPEVMERILRVVRHRGFNLEEVLMKQCQTTNSTKITLKVSGDRPISNLETQLNKLYDVSQLELHQSTATADSAVAMNA